MKKYFIAAMLLIAVGLYLSSKYIGEAVVDAEPNIPSSSAARQTSGGPVIGFEDDDNTFAWLGIPFAQPPVGELRWKAPRATDSWSDPLVATDYNNTCVQLWGPVSGTDGNEGDVVGSEDCLYLNVWSPRQNSSAKQQPLPVMVWIHGGGNTIGTANTYPANNLAGDENVVVVGINYRLGLFGWMSHPALRGAKVNDIDGSGNFGILDMVAALEWVKANIANFGGDPENVTIFGESAGGRNVYSLMMSPQAKGLFHKAIVQSGIISTDPLWKAENFSSDTQPGMELSSNEWLLKQLQLDDSSFDRAGAMQKLAAMSQQKIREFMYSRTPAQMLQGISGFAGMYESPQNFRDGVVLPKDSQYSQLASVSNYNSVPLLVGTNKDEAKLFMAQSPTHVKKLLGLFPRIRNVETYNRTAAYTTDWWKAWSVDEVANRISQNSDSPVYAYRWDWDEGAKSWAVDFSELIGAAHGLEVQYVFGNLERGNWIPGLYNEDNIPGRDELSRQMQSYWSEFARTGKPGKGREGDLTEWQAWKNNADNLMLLDTKAGGGLRMVNQPMTIAMLKERVAQDQHLNLQERCAVHAELFFKANSGEDFWNIKEFNELGCEGMNPWQLEVPR